MIKQALIRFAAIAAMLSLLAFALGEESLLQRTAILITSPHVARDLKLSAGQVVRRDQLVAAYHSAREEIVKRMEAGPKDQLDAGNAELDKAQALMDTELLAILTPTQINRLKQIAIQQVGNEALLDAAVARDMALTSAQSAKIKAILDKVAAARDAYDNALGEALAKIPDPGSDEASIEAYQKKQRQVVQSMKPKQQNYLLTLGASDKQIKAVLTPAQKQRWVALNGKLLKPG